jgi:hypothetical protein
MVPASELPALPSIAVKYSRVLYRIIAENAIKLVEKSWMYLTIQK